MKSGLVLLCIACTAKLALSQDEPYTVNPSEYSPEALKIMDRLIFERYTGPSKAMQQAIEEHIPIWRAIESEAIRSFPWPRQLTFRFSHDKTNNAYYHPRGKNGLPEISVDYGYIEHVASVYRDKGVKLNEWGFTPEQLACYEVDSTLGHELGHAVESEFRLPVVGRPEDVADQFGLLWIRKQQTGMLAAAASIKYYLLNKGGRVEDTHALDEQRAYEALSLLHGFAPQEFSFVQKMIGKRAEGTQYESEKLRRAWNVLLKPITNQAEFFIGEGAWGGNKFLVTNYLNMPVQLQLKNVAFDFSANRSSLTLQPCSSQYYPSAFSALGVAYVSVNPIPGKDLGVEGIGIEKFADKSNGWQNTVYKTEATPDNEFQVQVYEQGKPGKDRLYPGNSMRPAATLESPNGRYKLICRSQGGLVVRQLDAQNEANTWAINASSPGTLYLDRSGRLHLDSDSYDPNNVSENPELWEVPASGKIGQHYLVMQDDGSLALKCQELSNETIVWSSRTNNYQPLTSNQTPIQTSTSSPVSSSTLGPSQLEITNGQTLPTGQKLFAKDGSFYLICQSDGNLAIYRTADNSVSWSTGTHAGPVRLELEPEGSLVLRETSGREVWRANGVDSDGAKNSRLRVGTNGILYLVNLEEGFKVRWSSH